MGYSYNFDYFGDAVGTRTEEGWAAFIAIYLIIILFSAAVSLVLYLLQAFGLYKMSKTAGVGAPWLAFVPVANIYTLGKLAETPVGSKKPLRYSLILLFCYIGIFVLTAAILFLFITTMIFWDLEYTIDTSVIGGPFIVGLLLGYLALAALTIVYSVFFYIALYKIYKLFAPENAVIFLILTIFFSIAMPIIFFVLRNKSIHGYGEGQVPPIGAPGYNPAYASQSYNPYGYNQNSYAPAGTENVKSTNAEPKTEHNSDLPQTFGTQDGSSAKDDNNDENI